MDAVRVGRSIRALRIRRGWRQQDLADAARASRPAISRIENGALGRSTIDVLEGICHALGAELDVRLRWHGEALDRLIDEAHAGIVDRFVRTLRSASWEAAVEVTFSEYGERGSVDVLGWHPATSSLLICEIKSVVADAQGTLAPLDRKARLGGRIGALRGWSCQTVSRVLVVRDGSTNRRRVHALAATFDVDLPVRTAAFRTWLHAPRGAVSALVFLPDVPQKSTRRHVAGLQRVNRPRSARILSQ